MARRPAAPAAATDQGTTRLESELQPLPAEIIDGVLILDGTGPYSAGRLAAPGPLVIRGDPDQRTVIVIGDEPLELWAEQVVLENLVIRSNSALANPGAMLAVNSQHLGLRNCVFQCTATDSNIAGLSWASLDEASATAPQFAVVNCLFTGTDSSLLLKSSPASILIQNVLQLSGGNLIEFGGRQDRARTAVTLNHVTLRQSRSLIRITGSDSDRAPALVITMENSALDLAPDQSALVLFATDPTSDWHSRIRITGQDSLIRPGTALAAVAAGDSAVAILPDANRMYIDGLFAADFSFAGERHLNPADAAVSGSNLFGHSLTPPGADPAAFSPFEADAYNSESEQ